MEIQRFVASPDGGSIGKHKPKLNPNLSSYAEYWHSIDPIKRHAIGQYHAIAGAHNSLWMKYIKEH